MWCRHQSSDRAFPQHPGNASGGSEPGDIGVGQFIDKDELWSGRQDCIEIDFREIVTFRYSPSFRDDRKPFYQCFCLGPAMCLNIPDFYVNSLILPEVSCLKHLIRLAYAGNVSKENFEFAPVLSAALHLARGQEEYRDPGDFLDGRP